jgi:hypothetical protein
MRQCSVQPMIVFPATASISASTPSRKRVHKENEATLRSKSSIVYLGMLVLR